MQSIDLKRIKDQHVFGSRKLEDDGGEVPQWLKNKTDENIRLRKSKTIIIRKQKTKKEI